MRPRYPIRVTHHAEVLETASAARTIWEAMSSQTRTDLLAPRLLLLFAVLVCMLGLGPAGAGAAETPSVQTGDTPGVSALFQAPDDHAGHRSATADLATPLTSQAPSENGAHGSGDHQSLSCAVIAAAVALGVLAAPSAVGSGSPGLAPPVSSRGETLVAAQPRPPDIATLCVQRI